MEYNEIFITLFIFITLLIVILVVSPLNIIITSNIINENVKVDLNIKYIFGIINLKLPVYPKKKKKKKKKNSVIKEQILKRRKSIKGISVETIVGTYRFLRKINIKEVYCDINYGNVNVEFTSFIYVFINLIYSNIAAYLHADKMLLRVTPNYTSNGINANLVFHIKITYKDLLRLIKLIFENMKKNKEVVRNGRSKFNKESYGNNS